MKIGIIHMGFFYSGGGEKTVLKQAKYLEKKGHEVEVFAPVINNDCFPELRKDVKCIEICDWIPRNIPLKPAISMITSCISIPYNKMSRNEVILAHGQPSNWIAYQIYLQKGTPYYTYLHQVNRFQRPRKVDIQSKWGTDANIKLLKILNEKNLIIKLLDKKSVINSLGIITNSKWIGNQIAEYYKKKAVVCYPGIDIQDPVTREKKGKIVLTTNRHVPQKRIDYLIKVMKRVLQKIPTAKCIITGSFTKHTQDLIELRNRLGLQKNVIFTGILSEIELKKAYSSASVYCFTSPEEDLGLGPIEAGAFGIPSVVWDYAGPRETVINRITGIRVEPYNIEIMANQIIDLLSHQEKCQKMGSNARKFVNTNFSWEKHTDILVKEIKEHIQ